MRFTRTRVLATSIVIAGVATALAPGSPALAFISPPLVLLGQAESPAYLVAKGAAVDVTVQYTCTADVMFVGVRLTEAVGKKIASGSGYTNVTCDGATHRVVIRVNANGFGVAFATGKAVADTDVSGCRTRNDRFMCGNDTDTRTITIKK